MSAESVGHNEQHVMYRMVWSSAMRNTESIIAAKTRANLPDCDMNGRIASREGGNKSNFKGQSSYIAHSDQLVQHSRPLSSLLSSCFVGSR